MTINIIDIGLMTVFVMIACLGFLGGTIRLFLVLVSLYLGTVIAAFFYLPVAGMLFRLLVGVDSFSARLIAFFLVLLLVTGALAFTLIHTITIRRLPPTFAGLDHIGGGALGVITAAFSVVLICIALRLTFDFVTQLSAAGAPMWPAALNLAAQSRGSIIAHMFLSLSEPLFALLQPWFPGGLPNILRYG